MRKVVMIAGLLLAAGVVSSTPTQAASVGCACVKLGAPAVCRATIADCNLKVGGVCLATCAYDEPKKGRRHKKKM